MKYKSQFNEYFKEVLHNYRGYNIYDIEHSVFRYTERVGKDLFIYFKLLKKGINYIIDNNKEYTEDRYIFVSKKYGFGIQVEWRPDRFNPKIYHGYSATTLSNEEMKFLLRKDKKIFLENIQKEGYSLKESLNIYNKGYSVYNFNKELKEELDLCYYKKFVQSGKIYYDFELIIA